MSRNHFIYPVLGLLLLLGAFYACEEEDLPGEFEIQQISRLYVSFEEYNPDSDVERDTNIRVIEPADSSVFAFQESHVSQVQGGGPLYFNPFVKTLFQASANANGVDTVISTVNVERTGRLNNNGDGLRSRYFQHVRGITYHSAMQALIVVHGVDESTGEDPEAGIYLIDNPGRGGAQKQPYKKLINPDLKMWGAAYRADQVFTTKLSAPAGLYMFKNITIQPVRAVDSTATLHPSASWTIAGASTKLRGMSYDTVKNVLAIAEMGDEAQLGSGRILIFTNFSNTIARPEATIRPTRVITGPNTGLISPVDVVIDSRAGNEFLYVADRTAKKVSRFKYTDEGDVVPDEVVDTKAVFGATPVGLALDARDETNFPRVPGQ